MTATVVAGDVPRERFADVPRRRSSPTGRRGARLRLGHSSPRSQLLDAMIELSREAGWDRVTTGRLYRHAGLSRRAFEARFVSVEDCFEQAVEASIEDLLASVEASIDAAPPGWPERVSAAVVGFLRFLEDQPARAWMSIVEPLGGGDGPRFARRDALERLAASIADAPTGAIDSDRPRLRTAPDVFGGLWEMARQYLWGGPNAVDLDDVAGSAIFLALSPYVGRREAMRHAAAAPRVARGQEPDADRAFGRVVADARAGSVGDPPSPSGSRTDRRRVGDQPDPPTEITALAAATLRYLHDHPGAAGTDVADAIRIGHPSQASRHLHRLERQELVRSRRDGRYRRWTLTDRGQDVARGLRGR